MPSKPPSSLVTWGGIWSDPTRNRTRRLELVAVVVFVTVEVEVEVEVAVAVVLMVPQVLTTIMFEP